MLTEAFAAAFADLSVAITAINLYCSLNLQPEAGTTTTASAAHASESVVGDFRMIFLTLVAAGGLYAAVALVHRSFRQAEAAGGGGGNRRRLSDLVGFVSAAAGLLELFLFVDDVGALGLAAARVLPVASTATFFLGIVLIILAHIRAGGGAVIGDAPVSLITKIAFAAAAGLVCMMAIALCAK